MHSRDTARVAVRSVDSKGAIYVAPRLIELDSLPRVLCGLADAWTFDHLLVLLGVALGILLVDVTLDLVLTES